jgi:hypothetical protein
MCPGRGRVWITSLGLFEVRGIYSVCSVCVCVVVLMCVNAIARKVSTASDGVDTPV